MSINTVVLMGRLVADPELRTTTTGKSVCSFRVAIDRPYSKQSEEKKADFITIVAWEGTADFVSRYFSKGSMIALVGSIRMRQYEDNTGTNRTFYEVLAREVSFCGSKSETGTGNAALPASAAANEARAAAPADFEEIEDYEDLPF